MSENHVTIYATTWCPYCINLKKRLARPEPPYELNDVELAAAAAARDESDTDGNRIVPTVKYSDGTHATNPEASAVRRKLEELTA